jgi:LCP family protein required for cell wall assembly
LILGTTEDDPGHQGSDLTDSMMVVSIDQKNKNIFMFSVPRDLYVQYGEACTSGYAGKINAYFSCVDDGTTADAEQKRLTKTEKLVGDIFGLDIQYGIHANGEVIKEAVDAVGGIDVNIEGSGGAPGVLDRNFDWRCKYTCYLVKYDNGVHHLDGAHAWYLSMARGDIAPTYGLANSNFDREKNQQKILIAVKDKAMTTGILTNLNAVTKLIDAVGNNLRTNIQTNEIRTLMQVASDVKSADIKTLSLVGDTDSVVTTGQQGGASVVMPSAGIYDYSDIQSFIKKNFSSDPVVREAAPIIVLNGSGQTGFGQTKADALKSDGYNVALVDNAPSGTYDKVEIYQIGTESSKTAEKLASLYNVTIKKTAPPITVGSSIQFVIIFGSAT